MQLQINTNKGFLGEDKLFPVCKVVLLVKVPVIFQFMDI